MNRRIHTASLKTGIVILDARQAHHLRDVLRVAQGQSVELFDDSGATAEGTVVMADGRLAVQVQDMRQPPSQPGVTIASAVPKGERADWMVEKLSELGVAEFIPLVTQRSVVHPQGSAKLQRWQRIATESAKQSRRNGVMRIGELMELAKAIELTTTGFYLSTQESKPLIELHHVQNARTTLFIGPEGGWTEDEMQRFAIAGIVPARLTETILRVETAAITAAAILLCHCEASNSQNRINP